jgi:preprotein translocase subunit SecF
MEFFKPGRHFDFMRQRIFWIPLSVLLTLASTVLVFYPGPNYGTDFRGGTEVELAFKKPIDAASVRSAVQEIGFATPDVVQVVDPKNPHRFIIRVQDITVLADATKNEIKRNLCLKDDAAVPLDKNLCPDDMPYKAIEVKFSPGGDKINVRYEVDPGTTASDPGLKRITESLKSVKGIAFRAGDNNPRKLQTANKNDHRVEIQLLSTGDQLVSKLREHFTSKGQGDIVPDQAMKVEWVGPKAGKQLRDSARNSVAIAIVFIMLYLAFRFDLRFAPGVVVACVHDAMVVLGVFVILRKEVTLSTIAAILTIVGYSMNDTVVVYDRIRENLSKHRGKTFAQIINLSVSETLSRTILTSGATMLSVLAFFIWGTGVIKDFALAMVIGIVAGTYSSIYVAAPLTEWIDSRMAKKQSTKKRVSVGGPSSARVKA